MKFKCTCLIQFNRIYFNKSSLHIAIEKGNAEIVKILLDQQDIDVNITSILSNQIFIILET